MLDKPTIDAVVAFVAVNPPKLLKHSTTDDRLRRAHSCFALGCVRVTALLSHESNEFAFDKVFVASGGRTENLDKCIVRVLHLCMTVLNEVIPPTVTNVVRYLSKFHAFSTLKALASTHDSLRALSEKLGAAVDYMENMSLLRLVYASALMRDAVVVARDYASDLQDEIESMAVTSLLDSLTVFWTRSTPTTLTLVSMGRRIHLRAPTSPISSQVMCTL